MEKLAEILDRQRQRLGLNYEQLAGLIKVSSVYVSQTLRGKRIPKDEILVKLSEALQLDPGRVLRVAHYEKAPEPARKFLGQGSFVSLDKFDNVGPYPLGQGQRIPILGWVQAGKFSPTETPDLSPTSPDDFIYSDTLGRNLFALRVENDSMEPLFHQGDIIIINPNIKPRSGDFVIVRLKSEGEVTFKKLSIKGGRITLQPLNTKYDVIVLEEKDDFEIIGKVVERKTIF